MKPPTTLTIAGSDSGGGAGIQADLKTFAALETHGTSVITSVTAQNSQGVQDTYDIPPSFVEKQIDSVAKDFDIEWAKTGMLSNSQIIETVSKKTRTYEIKLVVDPVMVAADGSSLLKEEAIEELIKFIQDAKLVTPNTIEASFLAEMDVENIKDMKEAAKKISNLGPEAVLVKGGHMETENIKNVLYKNDEFTVFKEPRIPISKVHGTGCTFSAAITAELSKGFDLEKSIEKAGSFMNDAIRGRLEVGEGTVSSNPMARIWKTVSDGKEINEVQKAAKKLTKHPEFAGLIPEVGTNIAMAQKGAEDQEEVVGLNGRIIKVRNEPYLAGVATTGGSEHVANFVLTAMEHDPEVRAGMNVKFSEKLLEKCRDLGLEISTFDREEEPEDVDKTMEWGTDKAIRSAGHVPDIIFDRGAVGKEPMIRILGEKATQVAETALKIGEII